MRKIIFLLLPYLNKRYYPGAGVRWIIRDEKGKTPYCLFCGNLANVVGIIQVKHLKFCVPICKTHVHDYLNKHCPNGWDITAPCAIEMNLKFIPPTA